MVRLNEIRENEVAITPPRAEDASLVFIGRISTPWTSRMETPRQGRPASSPGPKVCRSRPAGRRRRRTAACRTDGEMCFDS